MGQDATTTIWVGLKGEDVLEKFPAEVGAQITDYYTVAGLEFRPFSVSDNVVGVGVQLYHHDWDYGEDDLDLDDLVAQAKKLIERVASVFQAWGVTEKPKIYLASDFS